MRDCQPFKLKEYTQKGELLPAPRKGLTTKALRATLAEALIMIALKCRLLV